MFVQVIQAKAKDAAGLRKQFERWNEEVRAGAEGFLGSTVGVSNDGEFIALARFESEEAARRNSDRPEQGQWWAETEPYLEGEARFYDSTDVQVWMGGGSNDAGFVQVIQGTARDRAKLDEMMSDDDATARDQRPDVIGGISVWQGNDFTQAVYFTSESEAREGEKRMDEGDGGPQWDQLVDNMKFIDLREPWIM